MLLAFHYLATMPWSPFLTTLIASAFTSYDLMHTPAGKEVIMRDVGMTAGMERAEKWNSSATLVSVREASKSARWLQKDVVRV
jgi:hypothetical protein